MEASYSAVDPGTPKLHSIFPRIDPCVGAPIGPDGNVLKTSVCFDIEESVRKAAKIEEELANSKVLISRNCICLLA